MENSAMLLAVAYISKYNKDTIFHVFQLMAGQLTYFTTLRLAGAEWQNGGRRLLQYILNPIFKVDKSGFHSTLPSKLLNVIIFMRNNSVKAKAHV